MSRLIDTAVYKDVRQSEGVFFQIGRSGETLNKIDNITIIKTKTLLLNLKIKAPAFMLTLFIVNRFSFSRFIVIIIISSSCNSKVIRFSRCQRVLEITITSLAA